jgi:cell division protein FtsL
MAARSESFRIRLNSISPALRGRFSKFSTIEKVFYISIASAAILMAVAIVFVRMKTLEITTATNQMRLEMATTQTQITQYNQQLQDLESSGKVGTVATKSGMSISGATNVVKSSK